MPIRKPISVAFVLFDGVNALDVAGPVEAFASAKTADGKSVYRIAYWSAHERAVRSESGLGLLADQTLPDSARGDLLIIPGGTGIRVPATLARIAKWLSTQHLNFDRIASVCTGAYATAEAGLLNGRKATTHWAHAQALQRRYPEVQIDPNSLFLHDGKFYSSGGVTAGIDLALELIEQDVGREVAMSVARQLVVFFRRQGSQEQFSEPLRLQTRANDALADVCTWAAANVGEDLSVEVLAKRAGLSARQFSRRFRASFGVPPATYLKRVRLDAGRVLLCDGVCVAEAAHSAGFASTEGFRRAFERGFGITPTEYQRRFERSCER